MALFSKCAGRDWTQAVELLMKADHVTRTCEEMNNFNQNSFTLALDRVVDYNLGVITPPTVVNLFGGHELHDNMAHHLLETQHEWKDARNFMLSVVCLSSGW